MIKVLFPICTLNWRVNNYVCRQGNGINSRNESATIIIQICSLLVLYSIFEIIDSLFLLKPFSLIIEESDTFDTKIKKSIHSSQLTEVFPQNHGRIEKKREN